MGHARLTVIHMIPVEGDSLRDGGKTGTTNLDRTGGALLEDTRASKYCTIHLFTIVLLARGPRCEDGKLRSIVHNFFTNYTTGHAPAIR